MVQLFYATYMYIGEDSAYYEIFLAKVGIQHIIYLKPKETLHFELPNISLPFLSLTKLNIAISCWYPP